MNNLDDDDFLPSNISPDTRRLGGIHLFPTTLAILLMVSLIYANHLWGYDDRLFHTTPHPFFLIITLMAAGYGSLDGMICAFVGVALLYWGNFPPELPHEPLFLYWARTLFRPLSWIFSAFFIGEVRMHLEMEKEALIKCLKDSREEIGRLQYSLDRFRDSNDQKEHELNVQRKKANSLYFTLKYLESSPPAEMLQNIDKVFNLVFYPDKLSVYFYEPNRLVLNRSHGWNGNNGFATVFRSEHPIYDAIVRERRLLSALKEEDADILGNQGLMAGPLIDAETGEVFGMVKIEHFGETVFDEHTGATFLGLCQTIGVAHAHAGQNQPEALTSSSRLTVPLTTSTLGKNTQEQMIRWAKTYELPLSLVDLTVDGVVRPEQELVINEELQDLVKPLGVLLKITENPLEFHALMPKCHSHEARRLSALRMDQLKHNPQLAHLGFDISVKALYEPAHANAS